MAAITRKFPRVLVDAFKLQTRSSVQRSVRNNVKNVIPCAGISTIKNKGCQHSLNQQVYPDIAKVSSEVEDALEVKFSDGSRGVTPYLWLRDNCQCNECYDRSSLGRKFIVHELDVNTKPRDVQEQDGTLHVQWSDGHQSLYSMEWLKSRSFTSHGRKQYRELYKLPQILWSNDVKLQTYDYQTLMRDDQLLLQYLMDVEQNGAVLVRDTPLVEDSGAKLIDHIAYVKQSHFGRRSPVRVREDANNLAWTNAKLGLHNDLAQYDHQAGIIFIHMIQQHIGKGGESRISDGNFCAEIMRKDHPKEFKMLTSTDIYFWDKGMRNFHLEMEKFFKIHRGPVIQLDNYGNIIKVSVNNAVRDSHLDLPPSEVNAFYKAMQRYNHLLYKHSHAFKMANGDMLTLDNVRCQHGREGFESKSSRHIESTYLDWDEARCRRRKLQEQLGLL